MPYSTHQHELETRDMLIGYFSRFLEYQLLQVNPAFRFFRIETPLVIPYELEQDQRAPARINTSGEHTLRCGTRSSAFFEVRNILDGSSGVRQRLPIVVWQKGKVFQQIEATIQETYNLEYHICYSQSTATNYLPILIRACSVMVTKQCGQVTVASGSLRSLYTDEILVKIGHGSEFWVNKTRIQSIEVIVNMEACTKASLHHERTI